MTKPPCFNRPPYKDTIVVQDGWINQEFPFIGKTRTPRMVEIDDPMSKACQQNKPPFGEAYRMGWDCEGCRWREQGKEKC